MFAESLVALLELHLQPVALSAQTMLIEGIAHGLAERRHAQRLRNEIESP